MLKAQDPIGKTDAATTSRGLFGRSSASTLGQTLKPTVIPASSLPMTANQTTQTPVGNTAPAVQPQVEITTGNRLLVGPDVKLKGAEILDCDTLVVEGRVEATMDSHIIRIAEQGTFCGTVSIDTAEIHGCFEGELTARNQLIIHSTGRVKGKIRYGKILIEEGGQICGDIQSTADSQIRPETRIEARVAEIAARA